MSAQLSTLSNWARVPVLRPVVVRRAVRRSLLYARSPVVWRFGGELDAWTLTKLTDIPSPPRFGAVTTFCSVLSQEIGLEERLLNDLFCV